MFLSKPLRLLLASGVLLASSPLSTCAFEDDEAQTNLRRKAWINTHEQRRVFVQYKQGTHDDTQQRVMSKTKSAKLLYDFQNLDTFVITIDDDELEDLRNDPNIQMIQEDPKRVPMYMKDSTIDNNNNKNRDLQRLLVGDEQIPYGIDMVQAPQAWSYGIKGNGVKVCVIDSGLDASHEDLDQSKLTGLEDDDLDWTTDGVGHGTHVTGTIAAKANNGIGVIGVAPESEIYTVKVFADEGGFAYASGLVDAANKCKEAGAKIISMSLGGPLWNPFEFRAYNTLFNDGVLVVAAAGNSGTNGRSYPASYEGVMSVAAIDERKEVAFFSQRNARVDIAAPGVDVLSILPMDGDCQICNGIDARNGYGAISGTSMATPHVSGVAALLWSFNNDATPDQITKAIQDSAQDLGTPGRDNSFGYGLVQALDALEILNGGPLTDDDGNNNGGDGDGDNNDNNDDNGKPIFECDSGEVAFELRIKTDDFAYESWWDLVRGIDGGTHLSGAGYDNNKEYVIQRCVPDDCYTFSFYDSAGDGICCEYGEGSYSLKFDGDDIFIDNTSESVISVGLCSEIPLPPKD